MSTDTDDAVFVPGYGYMTEQEAIEKDQQLDRIEEKLDKVLAVMGIVEGICDRVNQILDDNDVKAFIARIEGSALFKTFFPKRKELKK